MYVCIYIVYTTMCRAYGAFTHGILYIASAAIIVLNILQQFKYLASNSSNFHFELLLTRYVQRFAGKFPIRI